MSRMRLPDRSGMLIIALALILMVLVLNPILRLIVASFSNPDGPGLSFANYIAAYGRWRFVQSLLNALWMSACAAALGGVFAIPLAYACARTDMPGRTLIRLSVLGAFITPPYLQAVGWILLAGPNAGWLNRIWCAAFNVPQGPLNVFSLSGLVLVMACNLFFYIFVFVSTALEMVSSEIEDAGSIIGAGPLRVAFRITLPMAMPAIAAGLIVTFLQALALYGVPALLAIPARYPVVTTQLWEFFSSPDAGLEVASAYSMPLLGVTVALFWIQRRILARRGFVAVSGKGGERRIVPLGAWRWPMLGYALLVAALAAYLPWLVLLQAAFSRAWGRGLSLANLTFGNIATVVFRQPDSRIAIEHSVAYAAVAATLSILLAFGAAYVVRRRLSRLSPLLGFMCTAPVVIPGVILAIGFYAAYAPPPMALSGTAAIMILAFAVRFLPIAFTNTSSAIGSVDPELEEAVRILGGSRLLALRRVVAPLLKRSLAGAWILVFIPASQELSAAIFLTGPRTRVVSVQMLDLSEQGNLEQLAALGLLLLLITLAVVALGSRLLGRDFMLRSK